MTPRPACVGCGRPAHRGPYPTAPGPSPRCARCHFRRLARRHTDGQAAWVHLRDRWVAQGGRCAYTGEPLVLGGNASVDHRQPRTRGGTGAPANLQWVTCRVNDVKRDLTHAEFVALCTQVARHAQDHDGASPR